MSYLELLANALHCLSCIIAWDIDDEEFHSLHRLHNVNVLLNNKTTTDDNISNQCLILAFHFLKF